MERYRPVYPLLQWAAEREAIRLRRLRGEDPPWTTDKILAHYRFCNVQRKYDRVSQWLINNVLARRAEFGEFSFLQFTALCRWVNWPPTLIALREAGLWPAKQLDLVRMGDIIDGQARYAKTWTGAYLVPAPQEFHGKIGKGQFIAAKVVGEGMEEHRAAILRAIRSNSVEVTWSALSEVYFFGSFIAGQVVADWTYTPLLDRATDLYTWAPQGPGSVRGYRRMLGLEANGPAPDMATWCDRLCDWRAYLVDDLGRRFGSDYSGLTLHDVQNVLCELDKFMRVKSGEGRPRSKYRPEMGYALVETGF